MLHGYILTRTMRLRELVKRSHKKIEQLRSSLPKIGGSTPIQFKISKISIPLIYKLYLTIISCILLVTVHSCLFI